ncbi:hypothetical protein [Streptomyces sp. NEAU-YJ-81]|uniref:hypothetical protein n=1 Tax=Streptomyces sp. NEAU-YJ-81 TaxID=2820288 RepID=UPI001ABC8DDA|nr:hypothetical protein [Streptomyces sp. NEAU-YJ-81]MBO3681719.1 hypothetical protein [Streptomyces sp. NEAU-YJ-81]
MPVETTHLLVAELRGDLLVPCGPVHNGQAPERAASKVLLGAPRGILVLRQVAVDWVQMRRRQIITYVVATKPLTHADAARLTYRDGRADLWMLPIAQVTSALPTLAQARVLAGLKALAEEEMAYLEAGVVSRTDSATGSRPLRGERRAAFP